MDYLNTYLHSGLNINVYGWPITPRRAENLVSLQYHIKEVTAGFEMEPAEARKLALFLNHAADETERETDAFKLAHFDKKSCGDCTGATDSLIPCRLYQCGAHPSRKSKECANCGTLTDDIQQRECNQCSRTVWRLV
jgi:hypothetical protein